MKRFDVAVIGAGVVGAAIARQLSLRDLTVALVEAGPDVGAGTSKANTAILHTGFDATPDSLEAGLVTRGYRLMLGLAGSRGIAVEKTGGLLIAWTEEQKQAIPALAEKARRNGVTDVELVGPERIYALEPRLGRGALAGMRIPGESIICPYTPPLVFTAEAVANGAALFLDSPVTAVEAREGVHGLRCGEHDLEAAWVVNAAGLQSDTIDSYFGHRRFTVTARRGQLIVFDKLARGLLSHILLPVPTKTTKGVLVAPTVFGNVLLGPTAEDLFDKSDRATTAEGLASLREKGARILPELLAEEVTASYAGLRAATEHPDYRIHAEVSQRYICVGGIRSTGLSASLGIAEYVDGLLREGGLVADLKTSPVAVSSPFLGEQGVRPHADTAAIAADPEYGRIVCHCERVSRGEIRDALTSLVPARDVDGLRRRTRCLQGRCQGFHCLADVMGMISSSRHGENAPLRPLRHCEAPRGPKQPLAGAVSKASTMHVPKVASLPEGARNDGGAGPCDHGRETPPHDRNDDCDVAIVGGGPAGLAAAVELRRLGVGGVVVLERESVAGGVPRHCAHVGFGWQDLRRVFTGPGYARARVRRAIASGALLRTEHSVLGWRGPLQLDITSPDGPYVMRAKAICLATGCRERPRAARLVPGDRPAGVLTTGSLQRLVHLKGERLEGRAVVVGAEHVSFSAVLTLAKAGAKVAAVLTEADRHATYAPFKFLAATLRGVPVLTRSKVTAILGRERVEGVVVESPGGRRTLPCEWVVFTGDWIPEHELVRLGGIALDPLTRGPKVDARYRTSEPGIFAAGNLLRGAMSAGVAACEGRAAARAVAEYLRGAGEKE